MVALNKFSVNIIKNSAFNLIGWIIPILVTLITIPFYISKISTEGYGIWILIGTITGYLSLVQLGIGPAVTKYIAEYNARKDLSAVIDTVNAALLFSLVIGIVAGIIIFIASPIFVRVFNVPLSLEKDAITSLKIGGLFFFLYLLLNVYLAIFVGLQRFDISNLLNILRTVLFAFLSCLMLISKYGIAGLSFANVVVNLFIVVVGHFMTIYTIKGYRFSFLRLLSSLKIIFNYSIYSFISQAASLFNSRLAEIIIGVLLGPSAVTFFNVPSRLVGLFASGSSSISSILFPIASELQAENDISKIKRTFLKSSEYFSLLILPVYFIFVFFSKSLLELWISPDIANNSYKIMSVYSVAYLISGLTVVPSQFLRGFGKVKFIARFSVGIIVVSIFAYFPLINLFGIIGAGYSVLTTQLFGLIFIFYSLKVLKISFREYFDVNRRPFLLSGVLILLVLLIRFFAVQWLSFKFFDLFFIFFYFILYGTFCFMIFRPKILVGEECHEI